MSDATVADSTAGTETTSPLAGESIQEIEMPPQPDWFVEHTSPSGQQVWYVRFAVTGMLPRLFGPFPSQRAGLLFLDGAVSQVTDVWAELDDLRCKYACDGEFDALFAGPIIEHPLAVPREKGR